MKKHNPKSHHPRRIPPGHGRHAVTVGPRGSNLEAQEKPAGARAVTTAKKAVCGQLRPQARDVSPHTSVCEATQGVGSLQTLAGDMYVPAINKLPSTYTNVTE